MRLDRRLCSEEQSPVNHYRSSGDALVLNEAEDLQSDIIHRRQPLEGRLLGGILNMLWGEPLSPVLKSGQ